MAILFWAVAPPHGNARPQGQRSHGEAKTTPSTRSFSGQWSFFGHVSCSPSPFNAHCTCTVQGCCLLPQYCYALAMSYIGYLYSLIPREVPSSDTTWCHSAGSFLFLCTQPNAPIHLLSSHFIFCKGKNLIILAFILKLHVWHTQKNPYFTNFILFYGLFYSFGYYSIKQKHFVVTLKNILTFFPFLCQYNTYYYLERRLKFSPNFYQNWSKII